MHMQKKILMFNKEHKEQFDFGLWFDAHMKPNHS